MGMIGIGDLDWRLMIGDWGWGLGLGIGIGGLGLDIGIRDYK